MKLKLPTIEEFERNVIILRDQKLKRRQLKRFGQSVPMNLKENISKLKELTEVPEEILDMELTETLFNTIKEVDAILKEIQLRKKEFGIEKPKTIIESCEKLIDASSLEGLENPQGPNTQAAYIMLERIKSLDIIGKSEIESLLQVCEKISNQNKTIIWSILDYANRIRNILQRETPRKTVESFEDAIIQIRMIEEESQLPFFLNIGSHIEEVLGKTHLGPETIFIHAKQIIQYFRDIFENPQRTEEIFHHIRVHIFKYLSKDMQKRLVAALEKDDSEESNPEIPADHRSDLMLKYVTAYFQLRRPYAYIPTKETSHLDFLIIMYEREEECIANQDPRSESEHIYNISRIERYDENMIIHEPCDITLKAMRNQRSAVRGKTIGPKNRVTLARQLQVKENETPYTPTM